MTIVCIKGYTKVGKFTYRVPSDLCPDEYGLDARGTIYNNDAGECVYLAPLRIALADRDVIKTVYGVLIPERCITEKKFYNETPETDIAETN